MTEKNLKRKLTAILSADVVGYSRLADCKEKRRELMFGIVLRIVKFGVLLFCTMSATAVSASNLGTRAIGRPNVLFIVLDDVGYADLGAYGSEIKTPHMNSLAVNGLLYSNFHATPSCSPSRAALLTGREPHRVGMGLVTEYDFGEQAPAFRARISPKAATIAQLLKEEQYATYGIGKWHLVPPAHQNAAGPFDYWPSGKGFSRFYGFHAGSMDQFRPSLVLDNTIIDVQYPEGKVLTTDLIDNAIFYLTNHVSLAPDRPFFMYLSVPGMHSPHQASEEYLAKYRGKYDVGWDKIRQDRFDRQKKLGLIPKGSLLAPINPGVEKWKDLSAKQRKVYARFQEVYAGFLEQTDHEIGRVINELKRLGQLGNTLIVLVSDNGGSRSGNFDGSVNSSAWNNGVRETVEDNFAVLDTIGRPGSGCNYPRGWAQASNAPFPLYKTDTYGGGVNVPMIMSWPAGMKARGEIRHQYHFISDIMPTVLEILGKSAPRIFGGVEQMEMDGISMLYTFKDDSRKSRRTSQFYRMGDHRGIYHDGWAASARHKQGTPLHSDHWSLYNLNEDFSQARDISKSHPEKVDELKKLWQAEAQRLGAAMMFEAILSSKEKSLLKPAVKTKFTFYPGMSHLLEKSTPKVMNRSFSIQVPVQEVSGQTEGVLVAHGNGHSGYVLYMKNRKLVLEYNFLAKVASVGKRYKLVSDQEVPLGASALGFRYTKTGSGQGTGELLFNDKVVARMKMDRTLITRISHEGLDVGQDRYSTIGQGYEGPFPFTAKIDRVDYQIMKH